MSSIFNPYYGYVWILAITIMKQRMSRQIYKPHYQFLTQTALTFHIRLVRQHERYDEHAAGRDGGMRLLQHGDRLAAPVQQVHHAHTVECLVAPPVVRVQEPATIEKSECKVKNIDSG